MFEATDKLSPIITLPELVIVVEFKILKVVLPKTCKLVLKVALPLTVRIPKLSRSLEKIPELAFTLLNCALLENKVVN